MIRSLLLVVALATACRQDDALSPAGIDLDERSMAVTSQVDGAAVVVRNAADFPVRVALVERQTADTDLATWCFGSDDCGTAIAAGGELRVPLTSVQGYRASADEVVVFWWNPADPQRPAGEPAPVVSQSVHLR